MHRTRMDAPEKDYLSLEPTYVILMAEELMNNTEIVAAIDTEVARLTQVRTILAGAVKAGGAGVVDAVVKVVDKPRRGRPKGSRNKSADTPAAPVAKPVVPAVKLKSGLSLEARARIAAAQRARWARQSSAVATKTAAKAAPIKAVKKAAGKKSAPAAAKKASGAVTKTVAKKVSAKKSAATKTVIKKAVAKKTSVKSTASKAPAKKAAAKKLASAKKVAVKAAPAAVPSVAAAPVVATA